MEFWTPKLTQMPPYLEKVDLASACNVPLTSSSRFGSTEIIVAKNHVQMIHLLQTFLSMLQINRIFDLLCSQALELVNHHGDLVAVITAAQRLQIFIQRALAAV